MPSAEQSDRTMPKEAPNRFWESLTTDDVIHTSGVTVTETHLINWAGLTGDIVQLHLDAEYASETPFGQRIVHGPLTLSVSLGLLTQTGYMKNVVAWLGLDEVRAVRPVLIGDTISVRARVRETRPTSNTENGVWMIEYRTQNQRGEIVMRFNSSFLVRRAP